MAWRRPGDKPLSELMMVSLPTHECVTRPQWVKTNTNWSLSIFISSFLHTLWPVVLDNINTCIIVRIFHCIAGNHIFCFVFVGKNYLCRKVHAINQFHPCCVMALNMIKISSPLRLTSHRLKGFSNPTWSFTGTKTHRASSAECSWHVFIGLQHGQSDY